MPFPAFQSVQQTTSATASVTVTTPASLAAGDLMIAAIIVHGTGHLSSGGTPSVTPPAGWTPIHSDMEDLGNPSGGFATYQKVATAGDVGTANYTFTGGGTGTAVQTMGGSITRITNPAGTPIDIAANGLNTPTIATQTPAYANELYLYYFASAGAAAASVSAYSMATNNPTWTEAYDSNANSVEQAMAYANRTFLTATGSVTATTAGSQDRTYSQLITVAPVQLAPFAISVVMPQSIISLIVVPFQIALSLGVAVFSDVLPKWTNAAKSAVASFINTTKS